MTDAIFYTMRSWRRTPGLALTIIASLAMGFAAFGALFVLADAALFRPSPFPDDHQLVRIYAEEDGNRRNPRLTDIETFSALGRTFTSVGAWRFGTVRTDAGSTVEVLEAREVTNGYFRTYRVEPLFGRAFTQEEYEAHAATVVMLGEPYWQSRHRGDRDVLGSTIQFQGGVATVVGIVPRSLSGSAALFRPLQARSAGQAAGERLATVARLHPSSSATAAEADLTAIRANAGHADRLTVRGAFAQRVTDNRTTARILLVTAGLILLAGCLNAATLLLNRTLSRRSHLWLHAALGATPAQALSALTFGNAACCGIGLLLGISLADFAARSVAALVPLAIATGRPVGLDLWLGGWLAAIAAGAMLLTVLPATLAVSGRRYFSARQRSAAAGVTRRVAIGRRVLVGTETAVAVVLLVLASVVVRSSYRLSAVDLGIDASGYSAVMVRAADPAAEDFYPRLIARLRANQSTGVVGAVDHPPFSGSLLRIGSETVQPGSSEAVAPPVQGWEVRCVLPGYFETVGIGLRAGRFPVERDLDRPVIVVSEAAGFAVFGHGPSAIVGRPVLVQGAPYEIIGVTQNARYSGPASPVTPELYLVKPAPSMVVTFRPPRSVADVARELTGAAAAMHVPVVVSEAQTGREATERYYEPGRSRAAVLGLFAGLGLLLALIGLCAVSAFDVLERRMESAIRAALGASPARLLAQNIRGTVIPMALGTVAGLYLAWVLSFLVRDVIFQTSPSDLASMLLSTAIVVVGGTVAAWLPARALHSTSLFARRADDRYGFE